MKLSVKFIAVICSSILALSSFQLAANAQDIGTGSLRGDVNGNLSVQVHDATELQKLLVQNDVVFDLDICDVNFDEKVNIKDATCIQRMISGLPYETQPTETVTSEPETVVPTEIPTTPVVTSKTSTQPMYYSDFTTSLAYRSYTDFQKLYVDKYTSVMPGMKKTVVGNAECSTMTPQAICFAKNYMLITAYDSSEVCNSVIYVMSNTNYSDRQFITSIVLPTKGHLGGIAFDGSYVWLSNGSKVSSISYTKLNEAVERATNTGSQSVEIDFDTTVPVLTTASFMTYYDGLLWVGAFHLTDTPDMYAYEISSDKTTLTKKYRMTVPNRTQGVAFKNGYLMVSRSYSRYTTSTNYISQLRIYKPSWDTPTSAGFIYKNDAVKSITLPPMSEGIIMGSTYMYNIFESCSNTYKECLFPVDRIVAYKISDVIA